MSKAKSAEKVVQDIRRKTRRRFSAEEKIRIVLEGCGAKRVSRRCAVAKASIRISTIGGARSSSKPGRNVWSGIRPAKPRRVKSLTCGKRMAGSSRSWLRWCSRIGCSKKT